MDQEERINQAFSEVGDLFNEEGIEFAADDVETLLEGEQPLPQFPMLMVSMAAVKDIFDSLDFTGVGIILTTILSVIFGVTIALWMLGKMKGGWWKKALIRWFWNRYMLAFIIEFIPGLKIVPATTILVLMAHYRELKLVKLLNGALEILHNYDVIKPT